MNSYGDVILAGEGLQILTCTRHSWPLSSEGSLACHTYCDTGRLFIMVISEDPWHSNLFSSVWQRSCHYLFLRLGSVAASNTQPSACEANALAHCATSAVLPRYMQDELAHTTCNTIMLSKQHNLRRMLSQHFIYFSTFTRTLNICIIHHKLKMPKKQKKNFLKIWQH